MAFLARAKRRIKKKVFLQLRPHASSAEAFAHVRTPGLILMFGFSPAAVESAEGCASTIPEHYAVLGDDTRVYGANQMSLFTQVGIPVTASEATKETGEIISFLNEKQGFFAEDGAGAKSVATNEDDRMDGIFQLKNGNRVCVRMQLPENP